ncbi:unknown [Eubacterium sp. CAG:192]|nr:unknown [Eubacterium sp. CAG:192]
MRIPSTTVNTATINEFKKYLDIGIPVAPDKFNKFLKLSNVGFCTNNVGGNLNNSPKGLNALFIINITGRIINIDNGNAII